MHARVTHVLPDVLRGYRPDESVFVYAHAAHMRAPRSMISFTTNAISIVLSGRKQLQHGTLTEAVSAGHVLFFRPGHCLSTDFSEAGKDYRSLLFFFSDAHLRDLLLHHNISGLSRSMDSRKHVVFRTPDNLTHQAESIWHAADTPHLSKGRTEAKFEDIVLLILESKGADIFSFFRMSACPTPQQRLHQVVEAQWRAQLSWEEMAFLCHMSLSTFKRNFATLYNTTPSQWLHERRLQLAAHLLTTERHRPSDVFLEAGFSTASAFTQSFKNYFGVTPKVFQSRHPSPPAGLVCQRIGSPPEPQATQLSL